MTATIPAPLLQERLDGLDRAAVDVAAIGRRLTAIGGIDPIVMAAVEHLRFVCAASADDIWSAARSRQAGP